jgi:hypothetical protein
MSTTTVAQPHAGEIGEPRRKWYIVPSVLPVPPALPREDAPAPEPALEPEPERVGV